MLSVPFYKMHGCGNDFVCIDNRAVGLPTALMPAWARVLCHRQRGVGGDGLIFLENTPPGREGDYIWHFYNADGSRGEMCGNGSRCAAWLAVELGLAGPEHAMGTDAGLIHARVDHAARRVLVQLTRPRHAEFGLALEAEGRMLTAHGVDTGVPHLVVPVPDVARVDVMRLGRALRYHPHFQPAGVNVDFFGVEGADALLVRTYERGVEAETLACGTGAAASVFVAHALGLTGPCVDVTTWGGERLGIELRDGTAFLSGAATLVFSGVLDARGLTLPLPDAPDAEGHACPAPGSTVSNEVRPA